jgi:hypothetical protein
MSQALFHICLLIGFGSPAAYFLFSGGLSGLIIGSFLLLTGSAWAILERRGHAWAAPLALILGVSASAYGGWTVLHPLVSVVSVLCILIAWNLGQFLRLIGKAAPEDDVSTLEQRYLVKILVFGLAALGVSLASLHIQVRISFIQAVTLLILVIIGMMQMLRWILSKKDSIEM